MNEESLFAAALGKADPADRAAFLAGACPDPAARRRVEELLTAHDAAGSFLRHPVVGGEPTRTMPPAGPETTTQLDGGRSASGDEVLAFLKPATRPGALGRLAHYEVLDVVGSGGFGTVLKAFDDRLHRVVAIKMLAPQLAANGTARARFLRESRSAAPIRDEHVVNVFAVSEPDEPVPYLVMEFVAGQTLQQKLERAGPLPVREVLRIGAQTARGLAAAHANGLVHRDIKPANILMENGVERVKITDFGLARAADDASLSHSGYVAGTPMFMSPEQARGDTLDPRSDLFSLGSVLYALCTGRPPFRADSALAVLKRVVEDEPRPIREVNPEIPQWLADVVARLHAKNPADRFQTAREVADLLAGYLAEYQQQGTVVPQAAVARPTRRVSRTGQASRSRLWWLVPLVALAVLGWYTVPHFVLAAADRAEVRFESDDPDAQLVLTQGGAPYLIQTGPGAVRVAPGNYEAKLLHPAGRAAAAFDCTRRTLVTRVTAHHSHQTVAYVVASAGDRFTLTAVYQDRPNPAAVGLRFNDTAIEFQVDDIGANRTGVSNVTERLEPGEHWVWFKLGDRHYRTARFTVTAGGRSELEIEVTPEGGRATLNGRPLVVTPDPRPPLAAPPAVVSFSPDQAKTHQEAWAKHLGVPVEFTNDLGLTFRLIPPGEFGMGFMDAELAAFRAELKTLSRVGEFERFAAESSGPRHAVRITRPFYLAKYETTAALFRRFVETTDYTPTGTIDWTMFVTPGQDGQPVLGVSWADATAFCAWLGQADGRAYDLPTEAQWEYAARAGNPGLWSFGDDPKQLIDHAVVEQSARAAGPVGLKKPNPFGLFDMHGNVDEWCRDWHIADYYRRSPVDDPAYLEPPTQPNTGRVARGGAWSAAGLYSRSAARTFDNPTNPAMPKGFRVALAVGLKAAAVPEPPKTPAPLPAPADTPDAKARQAAVGPLRELVAQREKARDRMKILVEAGTHAPYHNAAAEYELADARTQLAEAEGDRATMVARLEDLVRFARAYRDGIEPRITLGADPPDVLTRADVKLAAARARLARAGGTEPLPPPVAPAPRPKG